MIPFQKTRPNPIRPNKGDFAPGHRAIVFINGYWIAGDVVAANPSKVEVQMGSAAIVLGMGKRRTFTWRRSVGRYVDAADKRAKTGACLALDGRPHDQIEPLN